MTAITHLLAGAAGIFALPAQAAEPGARVITFEEVSAAPQDIALNLAFAQQRIAEGDLLAAAVTLERILLLEPDFDEARVLYAGVLYRLGDVSAARREAELLEGRDLRPEAQRALGQYFSRAAREDGQWSTRGSVSIGYAYDDSIATLVAEDAGLADDEGRSSFVVRGGINIERSLSAGGDLAAFAGASVLYKDFSDTDLGEAGGFLVAGARAGVSGMTGDVSWQVGPTVRHVTVDGESYLTEIGARGDVTYDFSRQTSVTVTAAAHDQSYDDVFGGGAAFSQARDGRRLDFAANLRHQFGPVVGASGGASFRDKTADDPDFAYRFVGVQGQADAVWANGLYLLGHGFYRDYEYDGGREDDFFYARAAVGAPLSVFVEGIGAKTLNDLTLEGAVRYIDRDSSLDAFDAENIGLEARLIYRF